VSNARLSGSRSAQKTLRDHKKFKEEQKIRDLGVVLSTPEGRRFMFTLIDEDCGVFSSSYTGNSETYLKEGKRHVGIQKMVEVQTHFKDRYVEMISEAFSLKKRDDLVVEAAKQEATQEGAEE
jgi:hypothetical protein